MGRVLACAICKCAVLCIGCLHFLVILQQNTAVAGFSSVVPDGQAKPRALCCACSKALGLAHVMKRNFSY